MRIANENVVLNECVLFILLHLFKKCCDKNIEIFT